MKRYFLIIPVFFFLFVIIFSLLKGEKVKPIDTITMAVSNPWGPLNPAQQSTYVAAIILANTFQSLVEFDPQGNLQPQLALSWEVSPDLKTYKFSIDTSRQFSNGEYLTSFIIKKSFENSLRVSPASSNKSALDLLYKIEGYGQFNKDYKLSGVQTPSANTLILKFSSPFRQALTFLAGVRYAIYLNVNENYLGTGPYKIDSYNEKEIFLIANPYAKQAPHFLKAKIAKYDLLQWDKEICSKTNDIFWLTRPFKLPSCINGKAPQFIKESGGVTTHITVNVNAEKNRIFFDPELRRAIQYLIIRKVLPKISVLFDHDRVTIDNQFFLPFQPGRLGQQEVDALIDEGQKWVTKLIKVSQDKPINILQVSQDDTILIEGLRDLGLRISTNNTYQTVEALLNVYYKTFDYDLLLWNAGMGGLDPDALYHYLGRNGAISSPPIGRESVWSFLEEGRQIVDLDHIHDAYTKVARSILIDVPAVHLAFYRAGFLYFEKVEPKYKSINSYRFNLSHFKPSATGDYL